MRFGSPSKGPPIVRSRGGQRIGFTQPGLFVRAKLTWIAIPSRGSDSTVLWGRHPAQSRQRTVAAQLVTDVQRERGIPGQAWTRPCPTCHPGRAGKRAGVLPSISAATAIGRSMVTIRLYR